MRVTNLHTVVYKYTCSHYTVRAQFTTTNRQQFGFYSSREKKQQGVSTSTVTNYKQRNMEYR